MEGGAQAWVPRVHWWWQETALGDGLGRLLAEERIQIALPIWDVIGTGKQLRHQLHHLCYDAADHCTGFLAETGRHAVERITRGHDSPLWVLGLSPHKRRRRHEGPFLVRCCSGGRAWLHHAGWGSERVRGCNPLVSMAMAGDCTPGWQWGGAAGLAAGWDGVGGWLRGPSAGPTLT